MGHHMPPAPLHQGLKEIPNNSNHTLKLLLVAVLPLQVLQQYYSMTSFLDGHGRR